MPVPFVIKNTLVFQTNSFGWTESFLHQSSSRDLIAHNAALQVLAQKRAALLGSQSFIKAERVSVETDGDGLPVVGDSHLLYIRYNGGTVPGSDDPDTAVLVTMRNAEAARRRNMFLRGIWDDVNGAGGFYLEATAGWPSAFNNWRASMLAKQVGWWHSIKSAPINLSTYVMDPDTGFVQVTLAAPIPGFVADQVMQVRFQGVNGKSPLNGMQLIRVIDATHVWLEKPLALIAYQFGGKMFTYTRTFEAATTIDAQKIVTRRAGSPLLQSRGRRKGRAKA